MHSHLQFSLAQLEIPPKQLAHSTESPSFFLMQVAAHSPVHVHPAQFLNALMTSASLVSVIFASSPLHRFSDGVVDGASELIDVFKVVVVISVILTSAKENRINLRT